MSEICLDARYSTTRRVNTTINDIIYKNNSKITPILLLESNKERKGEGGLRKHNYYKNNIKSTYGSSENSNLPLVTVVTVVFNGADSLENTIKSVVNQTYDNVEYIIIDGGSSDSTPDIIRKYENVIDYWVSEPDDGIYDAWNKGVRLSRGEWITFLGADDEYYPNAIQTYIESIKNCVNDEYDYVSSKVDLVSKSKVIRVIGKKWEWEKFRRFMTVAHVGSMHHRSIYEEYGLYDVTYKICGDYELLLRSGKSLKTKYLDVVTAKMKFGGISTQNLLSFDETFRAKVSTMARTKTMSYIDKIIAVTKWKLRSYMYG